MEARTETTPETSVADGKVHIVTDENFTTEVLEANIPVLVDFWAQWCGPCKFMGPIFTEVAPQYSGRVKFAKLDVDENPDIAGALRIASIPTFMLISGRTVYAQGAGAMRPDDLRQWIDEGLRHMNDAEASVQQPANK
ncbi:MAG: thioredoxin [Chloroflexota bacterium]|nr:thioredoxin [Chloroflexota bacterium]